MDEERRVLDQWPYGARQQGRALRFRIEAVLTQRLGMLPKPSASADPAMTEEARRCDG
ncbi:hypothetical protein ACQEV2_41195 [Streptomyces sp. CA-251387]|uniref:hypothetical protein n=1 Tax=Streptomyces sp. CA-251387 TaxID=3240064 RepID=UPI003D92234A